jgi:hypothetical protein
MTSVTSKFAVELFPSHRMHRLVVINARPLLRSKWGSGLLETRPEPSIRTGMELAIRRPESSLNPNARKPQIATAEDGAAREDLRQ